MIIISKGSGHDARKRVARLQRDLINKFDKTQDRKVIEDFEKMSKESKVFDNSEKSMKWVTSFERSKGGKEKQSEQKD